MSQLRSLGGIRSSPARGPEDEVLIFGWPYRFFNTRTLERDYNLTHKMDPIKLSYNESNNTYRVMCKRVNVDQHSAAFIRYIETYIGRELEKATGDIMSQGPTQVEPLWSTSKGRGKYYTRAKQDDHIEDQHDEFLIGTKLYRQTIPYSAQVAKSKAIDRSFLEQIAKGYECEINWLEHGLQLLTQHEHMVEKAAEVLEPAVKLLEGVYIDLYWVDTLPNHRLRFLKAARSVDHSLYKNRNFSATFCDLHLVRWDQSSQQWLTQRATVIHTVFWPEGVRNVWHEQKRVSYGSDDNDPRQWIPGSNILPEPGTLLLQPGKAKDIFSWVGNVSNDVHDPNIRLQAEGGRRQVLLEDEDITRAQLIPEDEDSEKPEMDAVAEQIRLTKIEEKRRVLADDLDFDEPRIRPAPRLRASSTFNPPSKPPSKTQSPAKSRKSVDEKKARPDFIKILVDDVAKLITATQLYQSEEISLTINIGQLMFHTAALPTAYRPDGSRNQDAFLPMRWNDIFTDKTTGKNLAQTQFSRRLTSADSDALYLSRTPLKEGRHGTPTTYVFNPEAASDRVFYRVRCKNSATGTIAILEISDEGDVTIKSQPREIGYINIHFPYLMWDARMIACVNTPLSESDMKSFNDLLRTIWIGEIHYDNEIDLPAGENLYCRKTADLSILSCQRRRERIHRDTSNLADERAIYLHVTRVEELQIMNIPHTSNGICAYSIPINTATTNTSTAPAGEVKSTSTRHTRSEQRLWYEAHLQSTSMNTKLTPSTLPTTASEAVYKTKPSSQPTIIPTQTFIRNPTREFHPPEENESVKRFLRAELATLFNATHALVSEWDNIGSGDRMLAPHKGTGRSRINVPPAELEAFSRRDGCFGR